MQAAAVGGLAASRGDQGAGQVNFGLIVTAASLDGQWRSTSSRAPGLGTPFLSGQISAGADEFEPLGDHSAASQLPSPDTLVGFQIHGKRASGIVR